MKMNRIIVIAIFIYFSLEAVSASTMYNVSISGRDAIINTSIILINEEKITVWDVFWILPDNARILFIKDDKGPIKDYSIENNNIHFSTNPDKSNIKKVFIDLIIENVVDDKFKPLYSVTLSLPGISNEATMVNVKANGIISGHVSFNFSEKYNDNHAEFIGYGPINLKLFFSTEGFFYDNYVSFSDYDISMADKLYPIIQSITGIDLNFKRFPIKILPDEEYNVIAKPWSSGTHLTGGLILIKESSMNAKNNASIILHETMHGYNSKIFSWQEVNVSWFDEGMGKFVEHLVDKQLDNMEPELFGGNVIYSANNQKFILRPKGERQKLWEYYQANQTFMQQWNLEDSKNREFGYAFSELIIRDFVKLRGVEGLRLVYKDLLNVDHNVDNREEFNYIVLKSMNYDLKPCYPKDRHEFENCLNEINKFEFFIPNINSTHLIKIDKNITQEIVYENTTENLNYTTDTTENILNKTNIEAKKPNLLSRIIDFLSNLLRVIKLR